MAKIRMGMVGGGEGAFIGRVHRIAAALDGEIELVCGAFSSDPERARHSGAALHLPESRVYTSFDGMMQAEAALPETERMQFVAIVTPNHLHYPVAKAALEAGFHVMCDKPATFDLKEALQLREVVRKTGLLFGLTHTYTGYPMVKEARQQIAAGAIGAVRKVIVEYPQGWLTQRLEDTDNRQAAWRLDPKRAGVSNTMGDIGVHAANLAEYVTGAKITELCSDLNSIVEGRKLDDDGVVLLRFEGGARGVLLASQICAGEENPLKIRVYGEQGGLEWGHEQPNTLLLKWLDRPTQMLRTGQAYLSAQAQAAARTPAGHPEGYLEAFANLYLAFADQIRQREAGGKGDSPLDCPGIDEAVRGMAFIELAVSTSASKQKWHPFPES